MFKIPLPELKEKIISSGKLSSEELDEKIRTKINELSGLISEEGASHIIANELNIELVDKNTSKLKIKEIYAGMRSVTTVGKITRKFEAKEFAKGDSTGKVCSLILGDETGTIRVVFWNEQVDLIKDAKEDEIILIEDAYVRENNNNREIHLGRSGHIEMNPNRLGQPPKLEIEIKGLDLVSTKALNSYLLFQDPKVSSKILVIRSCKKSQLFLPSQICLYMKSGSPLLLAQSSNKSFSKLKLPHPSFKSVVVLVTAPIVLETNNSLV